MGGYVLSELGRIPRAGERVAHNGFVMTVLEAEATRVAADATAYANSVIGRAIAEAFAAEGCRVHIASRSPPKTDPQIEQLARRFEVARPARPLLIAD